MCEGEQRERDVAEPQVLKKVKPNELEEKYPQDANDVDFMKSSESEQEEVAAEKQPKTE